MGLRFGGTLLAWRLLVAVVMAFCEILISALDTKTGWATVQSFYTSPITLGSDPSNSLPINSGLVAPHHAEITFNSRNVMLRSLVGQSRTILNGEPVRAASSVEIDDGAIMLLGPVRLTVLLGAEMLARQQAWSTSDNGAGRPLALGLSLTLAEPGSDAGAQDPPGGDEHRQLRRANELLLMLTSALIIMARQYFPAAAGYKLAQFCDPAQALTYLTDLSNSGRVEELGNFLSDLVTKISRELTPVERWPV